MGKMGRNRNTDRHAHFLPKIRPKYGVSLCFLIIQTESSDLVLRVGTS